MFIILHTASLPNPAHVASWKLHLLTESPLLMIITMADRQLSGKSYPLVHDTTVVCGEIFQLCGGLGCRRDGPKCFPQKGMGGILFAAPMPEEIFLQ